MADDDEDAIPDPETLLRKALALLIDVEAYLDGVHDRTGSGEELDLLTRTSSLLTAAARARLAGNI
jgi:hypothetical protein